MNNNKKMKTIYYGSPEKKINVTNFCYITLQKNNKIIIPFNDSCRAALFSDPLHGVLKQVFIVHEGGVTDVYDYKSTIIIDTAMNTVTTTIPKYNGNNEINHQKTLELQHKLQIKHGSFEDEYPEQKMSVRYLTGDEKVLEIGANIGRNTMIIASLLKDQRNLVTLESDPNIARQLSDNRDVNGLQFQIEQSALSKRRLLQQGWNTIASDVDVHGYKPVNTITWEELNRKYQIDFDTLVLDCEGAFYYILMDMPEILQNIKLIIMENDYLDVSHKQYVDEVLIKNNFAVDYNEAGGWGPCYDMFFQVWKRT